MDDIDLAMLNAWASLPPLQQRLRIATARAESQSPPTPRPLRPFCLCIRASDTRLPLHAAVPDEPASALEPHNVTIYSKTLHALCKPVVIDWPGLDWTRAAARLGRTPEAIRGWIRRGIFKVRYDPPRTLGKRGKPVPMIWSPSPLDPSSNSATGPDPHWGTLWQWLWRRVPADSAVVIRRIPTSRPYPGARPRFRGWSFLCPRCEAATPRLFLPVRTLTLAHHLGVLPPATARHTPPSTHPGVDVGDDLPPLTHLDLACHDCHRIRYASLIDRNGWHLFINAISGGLLTGREVPKPASLAIRRKRTFTRHHRPAPRRDQILTLLLYTHTEVRSPSRRQLRNQLRRRARIRAGLPIRTHLTISHAPIAARIIHRPLRAREIAARLNITTGTVNAHTKTIYRIHGVHSRSQLRAKLQPPPHHHSGDNQRSGDNRRATNNRRATARLRSLVRRPQHAG